MNPIRLKTIVVSLVCCDLALLAVLGYVWRQHHKPSDVEPQQDAPSIHIGHATPRVPDAAREPNSPAPPKPVTRRSIESRNYKRFVANLRAVGCPELTIQDIIIAALPAKFPPSQRATSRNRCS